MNHPPSLLVDSHCHASPVWFEPVETLLSQMQRNGISQAVLVQVLGQFDNTYLEQCVQRHPGRFATVVAVDASRGDAITQLELLAAKGARGLRLRPEARSPGKDPYAIWRAAENLGLVVSCAGTAANLISAEFAQLVQTVPRVTMTLEHLGGWGRPDCDGSATTRSAIAQLSRFSSLLLKVPGLGQLVKRDGNLPSSGRVLKLEPADIVLEMLDRFGAERLLWGSDFPPVATREGYANALHWVQELLADITEAQRAQIFGGNARRVFGLL
jgi:L-fuconolactonase